MKMLLRILVAIMVTAALAGCGDGPSEEPAPTKPAADPDAELSGKADFVSNYYTTLAGELGIDDRVASEIDYPDWFHGYTVELAKGSTVQFTIWSDAEGLFRLYGPSRNGNGASDLNFGRAAVRDYAERRDGQYNTWFEFEVDEPGTYMVVYGPSYVWHASYDISTKCLAGCQVEGTLRIEELFTSPERYDGQKVTVEGYVQTGFAMCTEMACGPQNPCCNSCGASQKLQAAAGMGGEGIGLVQDGDTLGCGGNNCTYMDSCSLDDGKYQVVGTFRVGQYENTIEIDEITPVGVAGDSCETEAECTDGWCRFTGLDMTSKECVPYVGEGESCGGFAPPQYINACSPELTCVYRPFVADAPGACRHNVTVAELLADPGRWDGVRVNIDGRIENGMPRCTRMACTPANPCCNSCSAGQSLLDDGAASSESLALEENGEPYMCGGNECNMEESCTLPSEGRYRVVGTFVKGEYGHKIDVESTISLDPI